MAEGSTSSNNEVVPSLNLLLILKEESGEDLFSLPVQDLRTRLLTGIILRDKKENTETQFFWMDEKSGLNCFMLLPKSLRIRGESITNSRTYNNISVPRFVFQKEKRCTGQEITLPQVKYEMVRYLKVGGKFGTMGLSGGGSVYEVVLFLQLIQLGRKRSIYSASTKKLSLPDGSETQKPWERVGIPTGDWYPFQVGTFQMNPNNVGELSFDIQVYFWGSPDILIKGVAIQPPSLKR